MGTGRDRGELLWGRDGGHALSGVRFKVDDATDHLYATVEDGFAGLKRIVVGEQEYRCHVRPLSIHGTFVVIDAASGVVAARCRLGDTKGGHWTILARDTPALHRVYTRGWRGEPSRYDIVDRAGVNAMTITLTSTKRGKPTPTFARLGELDLGEWTILVACLAFYSAMPRGGG